MKYWLKFIDDGRDVPKVSKMKFKDLQDFYYELEMLQIQGYEIVETSEDYQEYR